MLANGYLCSIISYLVRSKMSFSLGKKEDSGEELSREKFVPYVDITNPVTTHENGSIFYTRPTPLPLKDKNTTANENIHAWPFFDFLRAIIPSLSDSFCVRLCVGSLARSKPCGDKSMVAVRKVHARGFVQIIT